MNKIRKLFGEFDLSWKRLIIFAVISGVYTAIMAILPITNNTSFKDITITFEVWILFGIFIIMNSKSAKDSALKCFVFFLISQPLIYLLQVPFSWQGWNLFSYYGYWFIWTLLTLPMGFIGYYMKKDKWWGLLILTPILIFLGMHYEAFLREMLLYFPYHLLSIIFCILTLIIYPLFIFKNKKIKIAGIIISILIILIMSLTALSGGNNYLTAISGGNNYYNTKILVSGSSEDVVFDNNYKVYLENEDYGDVWIEYEEDFKNYVVNAEFRKIGKTEFVIESPNGDKNIYEIDIERDSYNLKKK